MLLALRYRLLCGLLRLLVRCGLGERDLETVVLRHQLKILRRGGVRPRFTTADRAFLAAAARLLSPDRRKSFLVGRDTLVRWHRELAIGRRRRSRRPGRPPVDPSIKELILSSGKGESQMGLPQDQGRAPEARGRYLGNDHRHGAATGRPRPSVPPDRPDLDAIPQAAGVRPPLPRRPVRRGGPLGGPGRWYAASTGPGQ